MTISPSFAWLFQGGMLQVFGIGKWIVPLTAWLAPLFLLHFTRAASPAAGFIWVWLVLFIALSISNRDVIPVSGLAFFGMTAAVSVTMV